MIGSRPEQAILSRDTDMSKTEDTRRVIEGMVDGLNDHRIADIGEFFSQTFKSPIPQQGSHVICLVNQIKGYYVEFHLKEI